MGNKKFWAFLTVVFATSLLGLYLLIDVAYSGNGERQNDSLAPAVISRAELRPVDYYIGNKLRKAFLRMVVNEGVRPEDVRFNAPSQLHLLSNPARGVFHPDGGAAPYEIENEELLESGHEGRWIYNVELAIPNLDNFAYKRDSGNRYEPLPEVIAFLPGVKQDICKEVNQRLGFHRIPILHSDQSAFYKKEMVESIAGDYVVPDKRLTFLDNEIFSNALSGCFENPQNGELVYFQVVMER